MQKSVFTFVFVLLGVTINLTWRLWVSRYKLINFLSVQQLLVILPQKPTWTGWKLPTPCLIHLEVNKVSILPFIAGAVGEIFRERNSYSASGKGFCQCKGDFWAGMAFPARGLAQVWRIHLGRYWRYCLAKSCDWQIPFWPRLQSRFLKATFNLMFQ